MAARTRSAPPGVSLADAGGPCTAPLDAAVEYLRSRLDRVLPIYAVAMAPHAIVMILLIDVIVAEERSAAAFYCMLLAIAMIWRWAWLAVVQRNVQIDLQAPANQRFFRRLGPILLVRLIGNTAISWGSLLAMVPAFYGMFIGSFAAPLLLESDDPIMVRLRNALSWIQHSGRRLFRVLLAMTALAILLVVASFVTQTVLAQTILPSLLGVDSADLNVTLNGWAWRLRIFYFIFLLLDLFWTVASVFLYYDSQSRRMATDLRAQLQAITEAQA